MKLFKKFSSEFAKGTLVLFIALNIFNFLNFIFHFISARLLSVEDYGVLATLVGIIYIFCVPNEAIQTIVSRYSTKFNVENKESKIKDLLLKSINKFFWLSVLCFIVFSVLSFFIADFLKIEKELLILTGTVIISIFLIPVTRGVLQGTKKFNSLGVSYFLEGTLKIIFMTFLILIGWKVYGAISAFTIGILIAFAFSFLPLRKILKKKREKTEIKDFYGYSIPVLLTLTTIMIFLSFDIIFANIFFPRDLVGSYAVISTLSKVIFLGTWGISKAMFPLASEKFDKNLDSSGIVKKSFFIVLILSLVTLFFYYFIPKSLVIILFGSKYVSLAQFLIYPSIAMLILSLTNILALHNLSIKKEKRNYLMIFFLALQVVLWSFYHSSVLQFVLMLILGNSLLFLVMFIMSLKEL